MHPLRRLDAWLEQLWNSSSPGKAQARRRERERLAWRWRDLQFAARQAHACFEHGREHLDEPQVEALAAAYARLDAECTVLEAIWPGLANIDELTQMEKEFADLQQRYRLLERWVRSAVGVALGIQDVQMRIGQVQQAIDQIPPADAPSSKMQTQSPEPERAQLAKIEAHLQRLQQRREKLLLQASDLEEAYVQQLEELADDIAALEQRGLMLWRTLAPDAFVAGIAAIQAFQDDVARLLKGESKK